MPDDYKFNIVPKFTLPDLDQIKAKGAASDQKVDEAALKRAEAMMKKRKKESQMKKKEVVVAPVNFFERRRRSSDHNTEASIESKHTL